MCGGGAVVAFVATTILIFPSASPQPAMLLSEARLEEEVIFIGSLRNNFIHQALFPDIEFVCAGNLSRWTLIASPVGGGSRYPEVHVWRRQGETNQFVRFKRDKLNSGSPSPASRVYEALRDPPLQFEAGDVLGVFSPPVPALDLEYQRHGGPRNHYVGGPATAYENFNLDSGLVLENRNDYPLVSVDVTPPECAVGFVKRESLLRKASLLTVNSSDLEYREGTQRIIPFLFFPSDGVILNVTLGALYLFQDDEFPEVQLWRKATDVGNEWFKVAAIAIGSSASVTYNTKLNVHRYTPLLPVPVQAGDIVGLYQPYSSNSALRVYMQSGGPENYYVRASSPLGNMTLSNSETESRLPLISFQFSATATTAPPTMNPDPSPRGNTTTMNPDPSPRGNTTTMNPDPSPRGNSTTTTMNPDPSPRGNSITVIVIVCVVVVVMLGLVVVVVGVALLAYKLGRKKGRVWEATEHHYDTTTHVIPRGPRAREAGAPSASASRPSASASAKANDDKMEYNVLYPHSAPDNVIINGQRESVLLKANSAYGIEDSSVYSPVNAVNATFHPYEDVQ